MLAASTRGNRYVWLYDGDPEYIALQVSDASPTEGGYLVVFELENGETRVFATRHPSKYVAAWEKSSKLHGGLVLSRVVVSHPHPRYEKIKRSILKAMESDGQKCECNKDAESCTMAKKCKIGSIEYIIDRANRFFEISSRTIKNQTLLFNRPVH